MTASKKQQYSGLEDIAKIVEDVKKSNCFGRSKRQLKLFEYLLTKSLSDLTDDVTQYSIALDVLERPESFDSASDSIVRVEMHRLRANLEAYNNGGFEYLIEAPSARFDIIVKNRRQGFFTKGYGKHKSLAFTSLIAAVAFIFGYTSSGSTGIFNKSECSKLVPNVNIEYLGNPVEAQPYVDAVLRGTIAQQTSFNLLQAGETCSGNNTPVFTIQFSIFEQQTDISMVLKALDMNGTVIDSHYVSGVIHDNINGTELYHKIITAGNKIAMPDSTLARYAYNSLWASSQSKKNYGCVIAMYDSFAGELKSEFVNIHTCLENAVQSGTATLDNYGAIVSSYLDHAREDQGLTNSDPLKMAEEILENHKDNWIYSSELAIARIYYEASRSDFNADRMELVLTNTQLKYSTNPQVLLTIAPYYGYSLGRWDEAKTLSDYVKRIYSKRDQSVYDVDAGYALVNYEAGQDIDDCYKFYSEDSVFINLVVNACAISTKNEEWFEKTDENLRRMNIKGLGNKISFLESRVHDRKFMNKIKVVFESGDRL